MKLKLSETKRIQLLAYLDFLINEKLNTIKILQDVGVKQSEGIDYCLRQVELLKDLEYIISNL